MIVDSINDVLQLEARGGGRAARGQICNDHSPNLADNREVRQAWSEQKVCRALSKFVNYMIGEKGRAFSVRQLADAGVRRISLSNSLYRATMTELLRIAVEIRDHGVFDCVDRALTLREL